MGISEKAYIGKNAIIKPGVIIEDNVIIGDNSYIDYGTIIKENVELGENTFVGVRCILGEFVNDFFSNKTNKKHILKIGKNAIIRSESILYGGSEIGNDFQSGHRITIREKSIIGNNVSIGTLSDIQGYCNIGDYSRLHSNVHVGQKSCIGKYVWLFPYTILTNDPTPPSNNLKGVTIDDYAVICTGTTILPGVKIGKDALVGASSNVTRNVEAMMIAVGNPAKAIGHVQKIKNSEGKSHYPWRYNFDRGLPWEQIGFEEWIKLNQNENCKETK